MHASELDGRAYHDGFEQDRERDADLLAAGLRVGRKWPANSPLKWPLP
jgi:very-short-patch-repair endonuclease